MKKICKGCNSEFSRYATVNGKQRNLEKRKYCLICNPYGKNKCSGPKRKNEESKSIPYFKEDGKRNVHCNKCNKLFFTKNRIYICPGCTSRENRRKNKRKAVNYKGGKCESCGYNECLDCLCFHHIDPSKKDFTVSLLWLKKWELIEAEIKKCTLLCNNCHCKIHSKE